MRKEQTARAKAMPGAALKKYKATVKRRTKKRTGYAYPPVGKPLKGPSSSYKAQQKAEKAARALAKKKAKQQGFIGSGSKQHLGYVKGGSSSSSNRPTVAQVSNKAIAEQSNKLWKKVGAVATGAIAKAVFPSGVRGRKNAAKVASAARKVLSHPAVLRGLGAAAVGGAAYAVTRKTKAGGALGDALVNAYYESQDKGEAARMKLFRAAVAKARARGPVSSDYIKQLAKAYGFSTTNR